MIQILTINWSDMMITAVGKSGGAVILYFIPCLFIGNYILLTLFLAVIIEQFCCNDSRKEFALASSYFSPQVVVS